MMTVFQVVWSKAGVLVNTHVEYISIRHILVTSAQFAMIVVDILICSSQIKECCSSVAHRSQRNHHVGQPRNLCPSLPMNPRACSQVCEDDPYLAVRLPLSDGGPVVVRLPLGIPFIRFASMQQWSTLCAICPRHCSH